MKIDLLEKWLFYKSNTLFRRSLKILKTTSFIFFASLNIAQATNSDRNNTPSMENANPISKQSHVQKIVSGIVGGSNDTPLLGATISVKSGNVSATTNEQGEFAINAPENSTLVIRYVGYATQEIEVNGRTTINVVLQSNDQEIDQVVVTGMGNRIDRKIFTGATSQISGADANIGGLADPSRGLEGRVAGVSVQNISGTFGAAPKIRVRGATSIFGSSKPLWVIDGVIFEDAADVSADDLSSGDALTLISSAVAGLNAQDIETFQILKDGSATSIYGARAMAGVIVITTKRGSSGRSALNYVSEYTTRQKPSYGDFNIMNSQEQMSIYQEMNQKGWLNIAEVSNAANTGVYGDMYKLINSSQLINTQEAKNAYLREAEYRNTNWFDVLFKNSLSQNHSISLSSGNEKSQYYTSLSAMVDPGWTEQSKVNRYTANINANYFLLESLSLNLIANGSYRDQRAPGTLGQSIEPVTGEIKRDFDINPYNYAMRTSRTLEQNTFYTRNYAPFNILHELENNYMDINVGDLKFQGELKWKALKSLEFAGLASIRYQANVQNHYILDNSNQALAYRWMPTTIIQDNNPYLYKDPEDPYAVPESVLPEGGIYNRSDFSLLSKFFRLTGQYNKVFNQKHTINLFGVATLTEDRRNDTWFRGWGLQYELGEIPFVDYRVFKRGQEEGSQYYSIRNRTNKELAFAGMATYSYDNRYTLTGTYRYEGSNRLGRAKEARWAPTWNLAGKWNVYEEDFFEPLRSTFSFLELKASYSLTGARPPDVVRNSKTFIGSYNPWRPITSDSESGLRVESPENNELTYEKKHELNLGVGAGFFNNRLNLELDYFTRNNFDLIGIVNTQGLGGEIFKYGNVAEMKSRGVEFSLTGKVINNDRFSWTSNLIFSHATEEITSLDTRKRIIDLTTQGGFGREGYPVRSLFSIPFSRLNTEGLPVFTVNGSETVSDIFFQETENLDWLKFEGTTAPITTGGLGNTFNYKNFKLNVFMTYSFGNVIRLDPIFSNSYSDLTSMPKEFKNRWVVSGDENSTITPVISSRRQNRTDPDLSIAYNAYNASSARVASGDFIRMKDVSLSYDFPKELANAWKLASLGLRVNATNLFLIYSDKNLYGQDPEFINSGGVALPIPRQYTLTLRVGF